MEVNFDLDGINKVAEVFLKAASNHSVIALHGEMGAGKTTFVHAVCDVLGVTDTVSSPTFSIINQYRTSDNRSVFHIDLYRLKNAEEAVQAGVEDCLFSGNLCLVEWPERAPGIFPEDTLHLNISVGKNNYRKIEFESL